jgi:DNA-directed RNA polymerase specialized sigma24 family protein
MSPPALRRYRAERLLRKEFSGLRSKVLAIVRSQLRAKGVTLDTADLEACYAQAWHGLYTAVLGGEEVENPSAWLVLVTFRRAIDESRSIGRHKLGGEALGTTAFDPDLAGELDDRARLRHVLEGLRTRLSERECEAASLCYLQGLSRADAAGRMGIGESRMRKLMEGPGAGRPGVAGKVGELLDTIKGGGWCEQQSSLMRAFAFGVLDPEGPRHVLAVAHCRECPACRAHVASLRGLAAVLPPLPLPLALAGGAGSAAGALAGGAATSAGTATSAAGGVTGAGWSGLAGSLSAKLAVTGLVVLGAGYAELGGRAHSSSPAHRAASAPPSVASEALLQVPVTARGAPARSVTARSTRRSPGPRVRSPFNERLAGEAAAREFGPERAGRVASRTQTPAPARSGRAAGVASHASTPVLARSRRGSSGATHEFGFE